MANKNKKSEPLWVKTKYGTLSMETLRLATKKSTIATFLESQDIPEVRNDY